MAHSFKPLLLKIALTTFILILTLLTIVTVAIFYPYRILVFALSKFLRPDLADLITGSGNVTFAFGTPTVPTANVALCLTLDGEIKVEQVRERFQKNILDVFQPDGSKPYAKLQQTITSFMNYGFYRWVKDFNLNEYIRLYDYTGPLAFPKAEGATEKDLERIAGKLISLPYAPGKSHWELLVVPNYTPENNNGDRKTLLVLRISHGIADGYSIQGIVYGLTDTPNLIRKFEQAHNKKAKFWIELCRITLLPAKILWDAATLVLDVTADECNWKIQRKEGVTGENMAVFTKAVHVDVIKVIKNRHGLSYASVLLTALSSSIQRAMSESGGKIPNKISCVLPVPRPNHPGGLTNHVFASILPLPIVRDASPSSMARVDAEFKKCIRSAAPMWMEFTVGMITSLPLALVRPALSVLQPSAAAGIFPVDSHKLTMEGKLLSGTITFVGSLAFPTFNGATISMGGINNFQRISICMDRRAFPDEQVFKRLARYIEDEIDSMLQSTKSYPKSNICSLDDIKKGL